MYIMRTFGIVIVALILSGLVLAHTAQTSAQQGAALSTDKAHSAVILTYHRIDEDNYPATSLRLDDFEAHLKELEHGGYNIIPLSRLITALKNNGTLPEKSVVITFEGGYQSAYRKAMPLLLSKKIPFTVFYASRNSQDDFEQFMGWEALKSLARYNFVEFGILPSVYARISEFSKAENKRLLNNARLSYREHFGNEPQYFSYPFGEYSSDYKNFIETQGFEAAFGLQSGVPYAGMDFYNVPRFTMTEGFGDIDRFRTIANALPVPAYDIEPEDHALDVAAPLFGFSVPQENADILQKMQCFISGQGEALLNIIGENRLEIRPQNPLDDERVRINCTANTGSLEDPKWHWFGMLYTLDPITNNNDGRPPQKLPDKN